MFEHLDDDHPFEPDDRFRATVRSAARRQVRRRRRWTAAVTAPALLLGGSFLYLRSQADELDRRSIHGLTPVATSAASGPTTEDGGASELSAPINILLVGSDGPTGEPEDAGRPNGSRADVIEIVRIDPAGNRLALLSIPRDLWVDIGTGPRRINSYFGDDPSDLVQAVTEVTGIPINHFIAVDFAGFRRLVDLAGGVDIPFQTSLRDTHIGFYAEPGCRHLDGRTALAYLRARHVQTLDPATGEWVEDQTADLGRIARQQDALVRVIGAVLTHDYTEVEEIQLLTDVLDDLTVDDGLGVASLRALFDTARGIDGPIEAHNIIDATTAFFVPDANAVVLAYDPAGVQVAVASFLAGKSSSDERIGGVAPPDITC